MEKWVYERVTTSGRETVNEFNSLPDAKKYLSPFFADPGQSLFRWEELLDTDGIKKGQLLHGNRDTGYRLYRSDVAEMAVAA